MVKAEARPANLAGRHQGNPIVRTVRARLLLMVLCLASRALAAEAPDAPSDQATDDARRADAKSRYEQGVAAYTTGHFKDAVDHFLAADRLSPSAPLSFNIARAYEKLGDDSGALRWYRDYLRRSPKAANASDVTEIIGRFEGRLAKKGVQQLTLLSTPTGATVSIDGTAVGVTPGTFDLAPGSHRVVLILRGYADTTRDIDLLPDHAQDVSLALAPDAAPAGDTARAGALAPLEPGVSAPASTPSPAAPAKETRGGLGPWPWLALGAGGATLGAALTFELLRQGAERDAEKDATQVGYAKKLDTMQSRRTAARVLAGVGGTLVVAGGVLLAIDLAGTKRKPAAALLVAPAPGGLHASLEGTF